MTGPDFSGWASTARADQQRAAEAHTRVLFGRFEDALPGGGTPVHIGPGREPGWLRALLDVHQDALNGPDAKACDHVADGIAGPRCVVAWYPGVIVCAPCMATGMLMPDRRSDAEWTCDGCGEIHREGLRASVIQILPDTTFHLAICVRCRSTIAAVGE